MRTLLCSAVLVLFTASLVADSRRVEVDPKTDFSVFRTFAIRDGRAVSRNSQIDNPLTLRAIAEAIRGRLLAKGLTEAAHQPDLLVTFSVGEQPKRGVMGRGIRNAQVVTTSEGTLVIDVNKSGATTSIWHGVYADTESNATKLAQKLPDDARKLLSEYPSKN